MGLDEQEEDKKELAQSLYLSPQRALGIQINPKGL